MLICLGHRKAASLWSRTLSLLTLAILASALVPNVTYAAPSTIPLYFRSSTNAAGGNKLLNQSAGPTNCNIVGSKCITEAFACLNPFLDPCPDGEPKDFVSQPLSAPLKITRIGYNLFLKNTNNLKTLNFKIIFNLTKNGDTIYTQMSDVLSLNVGEPKEFLVVAPGNAVPDANQQFAKGDKIDCALSVNAVKDNAGKDRSAKDLSLLYNGKFLSGADSRCRITTNVCPTFDAKTDAAINGVESFCPIPTIPEFGAPAVLVAVIGIALLLVIRMVVSTGKAPSGTLL